jgi:hypothetical protein
LNGSTIGIMDPILTPNTLRTVSAADTLAFELLGYDQAAPEPSTWCLMATALGALVFARRRKR